MKLAPPSICVKISLFGSLFVWFFYIKYNLDTIALPIDFHSLHTFQLMPVSMAPLLKEADI